MTPEISVIMSVYNGSDYLVEAVDSVLQQSVSDFEFIIIDDCSTDGSGEILESKSRQDGRIVLLKNHSNIGLTKSLNIGLNHSNGKFIARQDADDVSEPGRLEVQLEYLRKRPETGLVGSSVLVIDRKGTPGKIQAGPEHDTDIRWQMLFRNVFKHATVMVHADILDAHDLRYNEDLPYAQDYDLWSRVLQHCKGANIGTPLVKYRQHDEQISSKHLDTQQDLADKIGMRVMRGIGFEHTLEQQKLLRTWTREMVHKPSVDQMRLCRSYFTILDALTRQPFVSVARIEKIRTFMVNHILRSISLNQIGELMRSGLYIDLLKSDFSAAFSWPAKRLLTA